MSTAKRTRRSPEEAKSLILDAAEVQLREHGPAGLRLQEVAAEAGVSHPTILHHFGNREGLVTAIVERTVDRVGTDIVQTLEAARGRDLGPGELLERIYTVIKDNQHGKLMSWLVLSGHRFDAIFAETLQRITDTLHEIRPGKAERQDTMFMVMLATLATLGDAVAGDSMYRAVGLDKAGGQQFRKWIATLVRRHMAGSSSNKQSSSRA
jgi:AcrR family transcriptional regulator